MRQGICQAEAITLYRTSLLVVKKPISSIIHSELNSKVTDYATSNAPNNTQHAIMRAVLAHRITSSGESTTHQSCRPRPSTTEAVQAHTLWLKVEEKGEQSIHTVQAPALAGALCRRWQN